MLNIRSIALIEAGRRRVLILGIDPGLANTGWGVIDVCDDRLSCRAYGCVTTKSTEPLPARLSAIHEEIADVVRRYTPHACAVESVFFGTNAKSAFATGQARGAAVLALSKRSLVLSEYSPVQIKSTVAGSGRADKRQVQFMVRTVLTLDHTPSPDHAADALAAAICHARLAGRAALARELS
jgi:crossover junction endodeoxyribonuclease RuvC